MYKETAEFLLHIRRQKAIWRDGELWTSLVVAILMFVLMVRIPSLMDGLKEQLGDILTVSSIVFGFVMTTLAFYVEITSGWSDEARVRRIIGKIIDWQVWSILCLIVQIAYVIALRLVDGRINLGLHARPVWFATLVFLTCYAGCQILNHSMVIWWAFRDPKRFMAKPEASSPDGVPCDTDKSVR